MLALAFALIGHVAVSAQANRGGVGIELGGVGSLLTLTDEWNEAYDTKMRIGSMIGLTSNFAFGEDTRLRLQPSVSFYQKGGKLVVENAFLEEGEELSFRFKLNYLHIPLQLQYRFSEEPSGFYVSGGPYLGIGLGGKIYSSYRDRANDISESETESVEFGTSDSDDFSRFDMGAQLGGGFYKFNPSNFRTWYFSLQFALGLRDLLNPDQQEASDFNGTPRNFSIQLTAGYTFDWGGRH